MPDALLDEVTALVEWPTVYAGTFDRAFLDVPQECLILTMQQNQKYFALADETGALRHRFLLVSNLPTDGARLRSSTATSACCARASPTPSSSTTRIAASRSRRGCRNSRASSITTSSAASWIASDACARSSPRSRPALGADPAHADRAAMLAKADLVTDMVGEFPELQGTMGRYYALNDGEPPAVADAIAQHYWPRFAGDALPRTAVATRGRAGGQDRSARRHVRRRQHSDR